MPDQPASSRPRRRGPPPPDARERSAGARRSGPQATPTIAADEPRYARIANQLIAAIASGRYRVGSLLPTEHELCEQFDSSRFTIREALRLLAEGGMVSRRPRAGTVVISSIQREPYLQALDSIDDLLQYASGTRLRLLERGWATHEPGQADPPPIPAGEAWVFARLIRHLPGNPHPVCVTRVYLSPAFAPLARRIASQAVPVYRQIEARFGVRVARVEQQISACALSRDDATVLLARAGSPALRIVRSYHADDGSLLEVSDSLHPAERFGYAMTIRRAGPGDLGARRG